MGVLFVVTILVNGWALVAINRHLAHVAKKIISFSVIMWILLGFSLFMIVLLFPVLIPDAMANDNACERSSSFGHQSDSPCESAFGGNYRSYNGASIETSWGPTWGWVLLLCALILCTLSILLGIINGYAVNTIEDYGDDSMFVPQPVFDYAPVNTDQVAP